MIPENPFGSLPPGVQPMQAAAPSTPRPATPPPEGSGVGRHLLKAIITSASPSALRDVPLIMLKEDERPLYEFAREHLQAHGQLPSLETLAGSGHVLPVRILETVSYYQQELKKRYVHSTLSAGTSSFVDHLRNYRPVEALEQMKQMVLEATPVLTAQKYSTLAEQIAKVVADYEYARMHPGLRGITFGWPTADELTLGAQGGDLIGLAGRTGQGKTWLMMEAINAAHAAGFVCLVVSMEMTLLQMAYRYVGRVSGINPRFIKKGELSEWSKDHFYNISGGLSLPSEVPLYFMAGDMDKQVDTVDGLMETLNPDIVYIDGAYLLRGKARKRGFAAKWEELGEVMTELKSLFIRRNRPCMMTVQLNRAVKKETKKERKLDTTDVGGADRIPQDLTVLWGVRPGQAPYFNSRRVMDWIKNREDEARDFAVKYQFNPVSFEEVPMLAESSETMTTGEQPATINMNWAI